MAAKRTIDTGRVDSLGRKIKESGNKKVQESNVKNKAQGIDNNGNNGIPDNLLNMHRMSEFDAHNMAFVYAHSPNASTEALDYLAENNYHYVIENKNLSEQGIICITNDFYDNVDVMKAVVNHPNTRLEELEFCAVHPDPKVRAALASRDEGEYEFASELAFDSDDSVVSSAVSNPRISQESLNLALKSNERIHNKAVKNPVLDEENMKYLIDAPGGPLHFAVLIDRSDTPAHVIDYGVKKHDNPWAVYSNNTSSETLEYIHSNFSDTMGGRELAGLVTHPNCPQHLIDELSQRKGLVDYIKSSFDGLYKSR